MSAKKTRIDAEQMDKILAEARHKREEREKSYRERAFKLFPLVCARCGREFSGKRLRELTVHHKDHNHDNNPLDGSNWELLCLYCHDNEHSRNLVAEGYDALQPESEPKDTATYRPFASLEALLKDKK